MLSVQHLGCRRSSSVTCPGIHHLLLTSTAIFLLYCYLSVCSHCLLIALKLNREALQPCLDGKNIYIALIFLLCPHQGSMVVHFICQWSHTSHGDTSSSFLSVLFLLCIKMSPLPLILIWGLIPGITWALESSVSCSIRLKTFLLPWLCLITNVKEKWPE